VCFVPLVDASPATLVLARRRDLEQPLAREPISLAVGVAASAARNPDTAHAAAVNANTG
jgi:hypothetical protein